MAAGGTLNIFLLMVANLAILHGFDNTPVFIERAFFVPGGLKLRVDIGLTLYRIHYVCASIHLAWRGCSDNAGNQRTREKEPQSTAILTTIATRLNYFHFWF